MAMTEEEKKIANRKKAYKSGSKRFITKFSTLEDLDWAESLINKKWNGDEIE